MANNAELIKQCEERAQQWLTPAFDEETRKEVKGNARRRGQVCSR